MEIQNKHCLTRPRRAGDASSQLFHNCWPRSFDSRRRAEPDRASSFLFHTQFASVISGRGSLTTGGGVSAEPEPSDPPPPLLGSQPITRQGGKGPRQKGEATQPPRRGRQPGALCWDCSADGVARGFSYRAQSSNVIERKK